LSKSLKTPPAHNLGMVKQEHFITDLKHFEFWNLHTEQKPMISLNA